MANMSYITKVSSFICVFTCTLTTVSEALLKSRIDIMKTTLALIIGTTLLVASSAQAGGYAGKTGWNVGADAGVTRNHNLSST